MRNQKFASLTDQELELVHFGLVHGEAAIGANAALGDRWLEANMNLRNEVFEEHQARQAAAVAGASS